MSELPNLNEMLKDQIIKQFYGSQPLFFKLNRGPFAPQPPAAIHHKVWNGRWREYDIDRNAKYPRPPSVEITAATFILEDGTLECRGHGWEADSGVVTRSDAEALRDLLTWCLDNGMLPDERDDDY